MLEKDSIKYFEIISHVYYESIKLYLIFAVKTGSEDFLSLEVKKWPKTFWPYGTVFVPNWIIWFGENAEFCQTFPSCSQTTNHLNKICTLHVVWQTRYVHLKEIFLEKCLNKLLCCENKKIFLVLNNF